jgi:hypothetical protein
MAVNKEITPIFIFDFDSCGHAPGSGKIEHPMTSTVDKTKCKLYLLKVDNLRATYR